MLVKQAPSQNFCLTTPGEQEDVKTITSGAASGDILGSFYNCGKFPVPTMQVVMIVH